MQYVEMQNQIVMQAMMSFGMLSVTIAATTPEEVGSVKWMRDHEQAVAKAKVSKKPLLILFQEVPG